MAWCPLSVQFPGPRHTVTLNIFWLNEWMEDGSLPGGDFLAFMVAMRFDIYSWKRQPRCPLPHMCVKKGSSGWLIPFYTWTSIEAKDPAEQGHVTDSSPNSWSLGSGPWCFSFLFPGVIPTGLRKSSRSKVRPLLSAWIPSTTPYHVAFQPIHLQQRETYYHLRIHFHSGPSQGAVGP